MRVVMHLLFGLLAFGGFLAPPTLIILGWARWINRPVERDNSTILSFAGFLFATASALLGVSAIGYSYSIGGFPHYDPRLLRIFRWGLLLSLIAVILSALGAGRPNLLRWHALGGSIGALFFWLVSMEGE